MVREWGGSSLQRPQKYEVFFAPRLGWGKRVNDATPCFCRRPMRIS